MVFFDDIYMLHWAVLVRGCTRFQLFDKFVQYRRFNFLKSLVYSCRIRFSLNLRLDFWDKYSTRTDVKYVVGCRTGVTKHSIQVPVTLWVDRRMFKRFIVVYLKSDNFLNIPTSTETEVLKVFIQTKSNCHLTFHLHLWSSHECGVCNPFWSFSEVAFQTEEVLDHQSPYHWLQAIPSCLSVFLTRPLAWTSR